MFIQPTFCCAILIAPESGLFALEQRPTTDADAPGRITCFGGSREAGESPVACLQRELMEELGFSARAEAIPASPEFILSTPRGPAWFFLVDGPEPGSVATQEAGYEVIWLARAELYKAPLADWHRVMFNAWLDGNSHAAVTAA